MSIINRKSSDLFGNWKQRVPFKIFIFLAIFSSCSSLTNADTKSNNVIKDKIIEAGCPFISENQLLERDVCLMPNYSPNHLPKSSEGIANVSLYLLKAFVSSVDEVKSQLTIELLQYLQWSDVGIRAKMSHAVQGQGKIKFRTKDIKRIWHPDLDIYTKDLIEWRSLFDPVLYQELYFSKSQNETNIKISALKKWKATIFCNFDFSLFPFDTQHCEFRQFSSDPNLRIESGCRQAITTFLYKAVGFDVNFLPTGDDCENKEVAISNSNEFAWKDTGFNITLTRIFKPYLYQYYFPSVAIVIVSLISFIIPLSAIPGRIVLVVTQFLTLTNIFIHQTVSVAFRYPHT